MSREASKVYRKRVQCTHILCSLALFGEAFLYLLAIANPKDLAELRDSDAVRAGLGLGSLFLLAIAIPKEAAELRDIDAVRARSNYVPKPS